MQRQTTRQWQLLLLPRGAPLNLPARPLVLRYQKPLLARPLVVKENLTRVAAFSVADFDALRGDGLAVELRDVGAAKAAKCRMSDF